VSAYKTEFDASTGKYVQVNIYTDRTIDNKPWTDQYGRRHG